jgi:hypothetical protein
MGGCRFVDRRLAIEYVVGGDDLSFFEAMLDAGPTSADVKWYRSLVDALKRVSTTAAASSPSSIESLLQTMFGPSTLAQLRSGNFTSTRRAVLERLAVAVGVPNASSASTLIGVNASNLLDVTELAYQAALASAQFDFVQQRQSSAASSSSYTSPFAAMIGARSQLNELRVREASGDAGVCAVVRLRLEQTVSLTRTAFRASLTLSNDADEALHNVDVELIVLDATRRMRVGATQFNVTRSKGVSGGTLAIGAQAELTWLLAPLDAAAPRDASLYFIGGTLRYGVGGGASTTSIELLPEQIVVLPSPQLRFGALRILFLFFRNEHRRID